MSAWGGSARSAGGASRTEGERLRGAWHLVRLKPRKGEKRDNWLLIVAKAKEDATALIARRTKSAEQKIEAAERADIADERAKAAEASTAAAARLIASNHDAKVDKALVDTTIARLN